MTTHESEKDPGVSLWAGPAAVFGALGLCPLLAFGFSGIPPKEGAWPIIILLAVVSAGVMGWSLRQLWRASRGSTKE